MTDDVFVQLANALDQLPNGFPRTTTGIEIRILKKIFSPEEAALASQMTGRLESVNTIAQKCGSPVAEISKRLFKMVRRGLIWLDKKDGKPCFRLAPFVVGFYEAQIGLLDHELAHLVEEYFANGGAAGIMGPEPALHRVIPAQGTIKSEWILPYDDVRAILLAAKTFAVQDCICRAQQDLLGHKCKFPSEVCLSFSKNERSPQPGDISQAEALAILEKSEQMGLVHTVSNVMEGVGYVCNCCGCCCAILPGITKLGIENSVAHANYYAVIDPQLCSNCGNCVERCQVGAISEGESTPKGHGFSIVDRARCIGCGLCVTGCPNDVARLERKPEAEIAQPPKDFAEWEHQRLHNRGLDQ